MATAAARALRSGEKRADERASGSASGARREWVFLSRTRPVCGSLRARARARERERERERECVPTRAGGGQKWATCGAWPGDGARGWTPGDRGALGWPIGRRRAPVFVSSSALLFLLLHGDSRRRAASGFPW